LLAQTSAKYCSAAEVDETSVHRDISELQAQMDDGMRNTSLIDECMTRTFDVRRKQVAKGSSLTELLESYPVLKSSYQVIYIAN